MLNRVRQWRAKATERGRDLKRRGVNRLPGRDEHEMSAAFLRAGPPDVVAYPHRGLTGTALVLERMPRLCLTQAASQGTDERQGGSAMHEADTSTQTPRKRYKAYLPTWRDEGRWRLHHHGLCSMGAM